MLKLGATGRVRSGSGYRGFGGKPGGDDGLAGLLGDGGERRGEGGPLGGDLRAGDGDLDEHGLAARSPRSSAAVWTPATQ